MVYRAACFGLLFITSAVAQNNVGIGTTTPNASAILDLTSTTQGFLTPRVTSTQMLNIASPSTGLLVFNTTAGTFYYYTGSTWVPFLSASTAWSTTGNSGINVSTNFLGTTDGNPLAIRTNNTERMRLTSSGSLGIGTTNPGSKLDLADGNLSLTNTTNTAGEIRLYEPSGSGSNYSALKSGAQSSDITYRLPVVAPTSGQFLTAGTTATDLEWTTVTQHWTAGTGSSSLVGIGLGNSAGGNYAIAAGQSNSASGANSVTIGGLSNTASGNYSTVAGGQTNQANGANSAIGGGLSNQASGNYTTVSGGQSNQASGANAFVGGGYGNQASGNYAAVSGGQSNQAIAPNAFVGGGYGNQASGNYSTISGGQSGLASGVNSFVGGGYGNQASAAYSTVAGGQSNIASGLNAAVLGGISNQATGNYSSIAGGQQNTAGSTHGFIVGYNNTLSAAANYSIVFGAGNTLTQDNTIVFNHTGVGGNATRVGIRNTAPAEALDVTGNVRFSGALMPNGNAGTANYILRSAGAGSPPVWSNANALYWGITGNSGTNASTNFLGTTDAIDLVFRTNNTEKLRIESGGDVGIGTTNPGFKLEVANGSFALSNSNNSAGAIRFYEPSSSGSNYTSMAARSMLNDINYTLPDTQGTSGTILTNDGSGNLYWSKNVSVGSLYLGPTTTLTVSSDQNNYTLDPNYTIYRISATNNVDITGFNGGTDGRIIIVINVSSPAKTITLRPQDAGSNAQNRTITASGNITLQVDESASFVYDGVSQRWRMFARNP